MEALLPKLVGLGAPYVVLKGGHLRGDTCPDLLATPNGHQWLPASRIATENLHGTGCALYQPLRLAQLGCRKMLAQRPQSWLLRRQSSGFIMLWPLAIA